MYEWRVEIIWSRSIEANGIVCGDDMWYEFYTQIHIKVLRDRGWSSSNSVANYSIAVYFGTNKNNSTERCRPWSLNSILARDCRFFPSLDWQQLFLTTGRRNLGKYVVLTAKHFRMVACSGIMSTAEVFENTHKLTDQTFGNCKKNFSCSKRNFNVQLRCGLLIRGMLILVTAQQLLPCDSQMLAWWLWDKKHYSRVKLREREMEFQNRLIKVNGSVHSVLLLHLKIGLKVFLFAVSRSLAAMGGIGSVSFCSTTIGVRSEIKL